MASMLSISVLFLFAWFTPISSHPLDPLTPEEIVTVRRVIFSSPLAVSSASFAFHYMGLDEPDKAQVLSWLRRRPPRRALVLARADGETHELVVDVGRAALISDRVHRGHGFPILTLEEQAAAVSLPLSYPPFVESVRRRGVELADVVCSTFTAGWFGEAGQAGRRLVVACFVAGETVNLYVRPIEGVTVLVDLDEMRIVEYRDRVAPPVPKAEGTDYRPSTKKPPASKPGSVLQPARKGFQVDGHFIKLV